MFFLLKTIAAWITSHFNRKSNDNVIDNISLETLNNKIRLVVWLFVFVHSLAVTFFSHTRLPIPYYIFVYIVWFGYLCLLIKGKSELIKGIPFMIVNFGTALALVQKGESYYLRLMTFTLPSLPIYSVQGFPPILTLVLGIGYYGLHHNYYHYLSAFYEPITQTYRIPELALQHTLTGYRVGLFLEIFCLVMYQIVVQRIWKNYQIAKRNIQETNTKLQEVNLQLAKNVEELAELNRQLNAHQYQDLFVACVSHELRNPLNVMLGSLDLLEPHIKGPAEAQLLKTCRVCGDVLLSHINNLLDVAKINADKVEINEFVTNMSTFLEKFWAFSRIGLEKKHLQGCLSVDKNLSLWLNIDSYRLHQILNNLMGNAIKFTKEGSVRVTLRCLKGEELESSKLLSQENEKKIDQVAEDSDDMNEGGRQQAYFSHALQKKNNSRDYLNFKLDDPVRDMLESILPSSDESDDNFLKIEIVDTGCGIPQESLQSVFEPFVQGDRSITRKYGGTGLGLYIVKSLVSKMGGDIKMTSLKNVGTHFQIILPVKSAKRVHTSKHLPSINSLSLSRVQSFASLCGVSDTTSSSKSRASSKRVLIVDDDPFNQTLLKEYFKKFEYECDTADNGLEGLEIYKNNVYKYAFITMDIQMPVMDGITASKKIREFEKEGHHSRVPLVMVTGNYSEDERKICLDNEKIQASYFFRKPFRFSDCKLCIERIGAESLKSIIEEDFQE